MEVQVIFQGKKKLHTLILLSTMFPQMNVPFNKNKLVKYPLLKYFQLLLFQKNNISVQYLTNYYKCKQPDHSPSILRKKSDPHRGTRTITMTCGLFIETSEIW